MIPPCCSLAQGPAAAAGAPSARPGNAMIPRCCALFTQGTRGGWAAGAPPARPGGRPWQPWRPPPPPGAPTNPCPCAPPPACRRACQHGPRTRARAPDQARAASRRRTLETVMLQDRRCVLPSRPAPACRQGGNARLTSAETSAQASSSSAACRPSARPAAAAPWPPPRAARRAEQPGGLSRGLGRSPRAPAPWPLPHAARAGVQPARDISWTGAVRPAAPPAAPACPSSFMGCAVATVASSAGVIGAAGSRTDGLRLRMRPAVSDGARASLLCVSRPAVLAAGGVRSAADGSASAGALALEPEELAGGGAALACAASHAPAPALPLCSNARRAATTLHAAVSSLPSGGVVRTVCVALRMSRPAASFCGGVGANGSPLRALAPGARAAPRPGGVGQGAGAPTARGAHTPSSDTRSPVGAASGLPEPSPCRAFAAGASARAHCSSSLSPPRPPAPPGSTPAGASAAPCRTAGGARQHRARPVACTRTSLPHCVKP